MGSTPCVDALEIVAHDHQIAVLCSKYVGELRLKRIGVLIFVHKDVQELVLELVAHTLHFAQKAQTVHKNVVEIHHAKLFLALGVQLSALYDLFDIKRDLRLLHFDKRLEILLAVGCIGYELEYELLLDEVLDFLARDLLDDLPHQFFLVILVDDGEAGLVSKEASIAPKELCTDRVERAGPYAAHARTYKSLGALCHFARSAVCERKKQYAFCRDSLLNQVGDPVHESARLAGTCGGKHKHGTSV